MQASLIFLCFWLESPKQYPRYAELFSSGQSSSPILSALSICQSFSDVQQDSVGRQGVHLLLYRGITLLSPGKSSNSASNGSSSEPWKAIWDHWSWKEKILPKWSSTSQEEHKQGPHTPGKCIPMGKNSSHIPALVASKCGPLLTLRGMSLMAWQKEQMSQVLVPGKLAGCPFKCH